MIATSTALMNRIYRRQRHIYDFSRKYYLLGRDRLIAALKPPNGGRVLEIGCGTGRNLIAPARPWPRARPRGPDIPAEMLKTARASPARPRLGGRGDLAQAD